MQKTFLVLSSVLLTVIFIIGCGGKNGQSSENEIGSTSDNGNSETDRTIVLGHMGTASDSNHLQQYSMKFKEEMERLTNGEVTVEIHPGGALGGERDLVEGVQLGTVDMTIISSGPLGNFVPESNVFDFPFLFRSFEHADKVVTGEIGRNIDASLENIGIKSVSWALNGYRHMMNSVRPIRHPDDLKGLKVRTMENKIHMESFKAFGADPTPMSGTELYTALQQGVVDGMESPLAWIVPSKFHEVQPYMSLSFHFYSPSPVLMNKAAFDSYSQEIQDAVMEAGELAKRHQIAFVEEIEGVLIQEAADYGTEIIRPEDFDTQAFVEASQPLYEAFEDEYGDLIRRIRAVE